MTQYAATTRWALQVDLPQDVTPEELHALHGLVDRNVQEFLATRAAKELSAHGYTVRHAQRLRRALVSDGTKLLADVLDAASVDGGFIARGRVYELAGYPDDRSLRGFTKPLRRVIEKLVENGQLPSEAAIPLEPIYDRNSEAAHQAQGFKMPEGLAEVFAEAARRPAIWRDAQRTFHIKFGRRKRPKPVR
jgi:hypothetical protein